MRLGQKASTEHLVLYLKQGDQSLPPRFGFVVGKAVGNSVKRNLVKRRSRSLCLGQINDFANGDFLVIRALPGAASLSWDQFSKECASGLARLREAGK